MPTDPTPPAGSSTPWPPSSDQASAPPPKPRVVSVGSLKDRIAKFNDLSAGSAPLLPNAPFGLGAPPAHAQSQARGGLVGNRLPSLDPKTAGFLATGAPGSLRKPSGTTRSPSQGSLAHRSDSPSSSRPSTPLPDRNEVASNRSASPAKLESSDVQGPGPDSLSKQNLRLNTGEAPGMVRQDSNSSAQPSIAAPSISSMQAQFGPSSTGSGEVSKMMEDVSGVSTPTGTPRVAAHRDLAPEDDVHVDIGASDEANDAIVESTAPRDAPVDSSDIHLREDAVLDPAADIEDLVGARLKGPPIHSESVEVETSACEAREAPAEIASVEAEPSNLIAAELPAPLSTTSTSGEIAPEGQQPAEPFVDSSAEESVEQPAEPSVEEPAEPSADQPAEELIVSEGDATGPASRDAISSEERATNSEPATAQAEESGVAFTKTLTIGGSVEQASSEQENQAPASSDGMVKEDATSQSSVAQDVAAPAKPRARLGPMEVVYLPDSDSEDEQEDEQDESGEKQEGDFLSEHPDETEDLHLRHMRLTTEQLGLLRLTRFGKHLERLCLRQNAITSPLPDDLLESLTQLDELDLYDNRLGPEFTNAEVRGCSNIKTLDLSFNNLRKAPNLPDLAHVETLYLVQNKITSIEAGDLDWCQATMRSLELGGNRLRKMENLEKLVHLDELWLGKNKIRVLENLDTFSNLKILSMQSNRITRIGGLDGLVNLEELYFSHNGLTKLEGLEHNLKLRTLDVGNNQIAKIENISHLKALEEFWASYNLIPNLRDLEKEMAPLPALETVYLEGNPCQKDDMAGYRRKIVLALPSIKQIDATYVQAAPYAARPAQPPASAVVALEITSTTAAISPRGPNEKQEKVDAPTEASFPNPPEDSPSGTPAAKPDQIDSGSVTPLEPRSLSDFPSVPDSGDKNDPASVDSDRVRIEVMVPSSPKTSTASPEQKSHVAVSQPDAQPDPTSEVEMPDRAAAESPTGKKPPPKSPLLDDEDPSNFEGGWATVTRGRES